MASQATDPLAASVQAQPSSEARLAGQQRLEASRKRLEAERRRLGPYARGLAEPFLEAAREAEEYGDPERALDLYRHALFSTRVNNGLYAAGQIPILENMLNILRDQGDSEAVAERLDYYYHLFGRGMRPYSPERLEASVRWLRVNIELLAPVEFQGRESRVLNLWEHAHSLTTDVCADPVWSIDWCKPLTLQSLAILYLIDWRIDPLVTDQYGAGATRSTASYGREWDASPLEQRLYAIERTAVAKGREMLAAAQAVTSGDPELALAAADWQWLLGRRATALADYQILAKQHREWFERPVPLPALPHIIRDPRLADETALVAVSVRVTEYGAPRDVVLTDEEGSDGGLVSFARRQLRELRFRPALDDTGEPVESEWTSTLQVMR